MSSKEQTQRAIEISKYSERKIARLLRAEPFSNIFSFVRVHRKNSFEDTLGYDITATFKADGKAPIDRIHFQVKTSQKTLNKIRRRSDDHKARYSQQLMRKTVWISLRQRPGRPFFDDSVLRSKLAEGITAVCAYHDDAAIELRQQHRRSYAQVRAVLTGEPRELTQQERDESANELQEKMRAAQAQMQQKTISLREELQPHWAEQLGLQDYI